MKNLGSLLSFELQHLGADEDAARIQARAIQVRREYEQVIRAVYKGSAEYFLHHTNAVYISKKDGVRALTVYVDESICSAELNAQRELIKLCFLNQFHEDLDCFNIYVSRGDYRKRHPFVPQTDGGDSDPAADARALVGRVPSASAVSLSSEEEGYIEKQASKLSDNRMRTAFEEAMTSD